MSDIANVPAAAPAGDLTAGYWISVADASLPSAKVMGELATGIVKNTTTTGAPSIAVAGTDYIYPGGVLGGQTLVFGTASANNGILSTNPSQNGQIFFGTSTNPSYWVDSPTATGGDNFMFKCGKPSAGLRQAATFCSRGNAVGDNVCIGFGAVGYGVTDGGAAISPTRIECDYVATNNQNLRFFTTVSNVATEFLVLDGSNSTVNLLQSVTITDAKNIAVNTSTGTKIGTATTQKLGFWNATPVVQYSTTGTATGFTAGGGTTATHLSTFTGNLGSTAYTIGDIVKCLKTCGFMAQ